MQSFRVSSALRFASCLVIMLVVLPAYVVKGLQRIDGCELIDAPGNDGDSFRGRSDPEHLVSLRAERRAEDAQIQAIRDAVQIAASPTGEPPDLNAATRDELLLLPGIGPVRAQSIIDHRPFREFDDLLKIDGIGLATVETLRRHARLAGE